MPTTAPRFAPRRLHARLLVALLALLPTAAAQGQSAGARAAEHTADGLTIATYNAKNFFDVFDDPYTEDETTRVKPREQIERMAAALRAIDADVVAFQEVENAEALRAMARELLPGMGYEHIHTSEGNDGRGISVGVMSRLPVRRATTHRFRDLTLPGEDRTWRFARDLLEVRLAVTPKRAMHLYVVHFKSKRDSSGDPESRNWRLAEASAARRIINQRAEHYPDAWCAMVGDLNDTPDSATLDALLNPDGATPLPLTDAHEHLPDSERITYLSKPYRSTIDYILLGPSLTDRLDRRKTRVISAPKLVAGSDHAPLVAHVRVPSR